MYIKDGELLIRDALPFASDSALLCRWWNDGEIMAHAGFPDGLGVTEEQVRDSLASDTDRTLRRCVIEIGGVPAGETHWRVTGEGTAEIGIKICDATMQNKGFGTRLLKLLIGELFSHYGYKKLSASTTPENLRARRVYEKLGFRLLRIIRDSWIDGRGERRSGAEYELTAQDWKN